MEKNVSWNLKKSEKCRIRTLSHLAAAEHDANRRDSCGHRAFEVEWGPAGDSLCCTHNALWSPTGAGLEAETLRRCWADHPYSQILLLEKWKANRVFSAQPLYITWVLLFIHCVVVLWLWKHIPKYGLYFYSSLSTFNSLTGVLFLTLKLISFMLCGFKVVACNFYKNICF